MIARVLSIAGPLWVYASLAILLYGVWQQRSRIEWIAPLLAGCGLLASAILLSPIHRLFFDEDIYIAIAGNLAHAPVNQVTLLGGPNEVQVSSYYKEPAGWPVLLSLVFVITGRSETVAFWVARILFAMAIAAAYLLARALLETRRQAIFAAIIFSAAPVAFWFSVSPGTDIPAALLTTLGMWGLVTGNGPLAAAGFALGAQTRMELLALVPLVWVKRGISLKWKLIAAALVAIEVAHVGWVMSVAPVLARAEQVPAAFSWRYVDANIEANLRYLFNPFIFFAGLMALALFAAIQRWRAGRAYSWLMSGQAFGLLMIYLFFYAGRFDVNPRYLIQLLAPIAVLAASLMNGRSSLLLLTIVLPYTRPYPVPYLQPLVAEHEICVEFASRVNPKDLIVSATPEVFLNHDRRIMNALFASEQKERLEAEMARGEKVWYHSGVRANVANSAEWKADQWVKSNFELHPVESHEVSGFRTAFYELLLNHVHREARLIRSFEG